MRHLWHTLYLTQPNTKLHLEGEALKVVHDDGRVDHVPLHLLESIVTFSYGTVSQNVMDACASRGIGLYFHSPNGRLRFQIQGGVHGNVHLREKQYLLGEEERFQLASEMLRGKLCHCMNLLAKFRRSHPDCENTKLRETENALVEMADALSQASDLETLRGMEGQAAKLYFGVFGQMILSKDPELQFHLRSRRPPKDPCNALLSFAYTMLANDCMHAAECAGLDPCIGFLHGVRPGKPALALDMMEELRPLLADRVVLRLLNLKMITAGQFEASEEGGVYLNEEGRKIFFQEWSRLKQNELFIEEAESRVALGLLPYLQAQQLARYLRGEIDAFHALKWR